MVGVSLFILAAAAQGAGEINYPKGALGYDALVAAKYSTAEQLLQANSGGEYDDPARLINLGQVYANTGRPDAAKKLFKRAMEADEVMIILSDGREVGSRSAARDALSALTLVQLNRR